MAKKKRTNRRYTEEFKREAIRLLENRGDSTGAEIAASLGIAPSILYQWRKQLGVEPARSAHGESLEDEAQRLRREISQMRKENLILKKSIALFVREMDL
jgi:transposase-like protein